MLGEIVVHGQDIRRPLGLKYRPPEAALVAVADSWKNSNLLAMTGRKAVHPDLTGEGAAELGRRP